MGVGPRPSISFGRLVAVLAAVALALAGIRLFTSGGSDREPVLQGDPPPSRSLTSGRHAPLPDCAVGDMRARPASYGDWDRTLVDPGSGLKPTYVPPDLVPVSRAGFDEPFQVRGLVVDDLAALRQAAEEAGNPISIAAAYRSYLTQQSLYHRRVTGEGKEEAVGKTARPGHSEHQLGTTLDFKTKGQPDVTQSWEITPAGQWMADNAWRYGFILSYPKHRTAQTCYWYEPWHYRYFGRERAAQIHDSGLTVREYLWQER